MTRGLRNMGAWYGGVRRFAEDTAGSPAVGFAIVMPILVALCFGAIDGGRAMLTFNSVERLARDGARYASVRGSESPSPTTEDNVTDYLKGRATGLDNAKLGVNITWTPDNDPGGVVAVQVTYAFDSLFLPLDTFNFDTTSTLNIMR